MVSFRPGGGGADRCSGAWKGCCAGYWKRGEAWCQGDLWKCRRRPADSAAIVPCFEASLRGYTEALCCSGLPSLSRFLLRASPSAPLQGSLGVGLWRSAWSSSSAALPLFPPSDPVELKIFSLLLCVFYSELNPAVLVWNCRNIFGFWFTQETVWIVDDSYPVWIRCIRNTDDVTVTLSSVMLFV